jgi:hypothetical protein
MNLTVGPLPPAVYWRRRVIVLVAVLALVLLVVAMCNGSGPSTASVRTSGSASPTPASPTPATTPSGPNPIVGAPGGPTAASSATAGVSPTPAASVAPTSDLCTDAEIQLTPSVQKITGGTYPYQLNLRIRNVSSRTCKRDVGAGPQEMHIVNSAGQTVWSSDNCQSGSGSDVRSFGPNIEASFSLGWDGAGNTAGCTSTAKLLDGNYQIVAKLDTKVSAPVSFTIGAAGK